MFWAIAVLAVLGAVLFLFMDIEVAVRYLEEGEENGVFLEVFYLNRLFKREYSYKNLRFRLGRLLPIVQGKKEVEGEKGEPVWGWDLKVGLEEARKYLSNIMSFRSGLYHFQPLKSFYLRTIEIKEFFWETNLGGRDAMATGLLSGGLWGIKGALLAYIGNKVRLRKASIKVVPRFDREGFQTSFNCILRIKVIHIIITTFLVRRAKSAG